MSDNASKRHFAGILEGAARIMALCPAAALTGAIITPSIAAASDLERYFSGGPACYGRVYDAAHLKRNPRQQVERISVPFPNANGSPEDTFEL